MKRPLVLSYARMRLLAINRWSWAMKLFFVRTYKTIFENAASALRVEQAIVLNLTVNIPRSLYLNIDECSHSSRNVPRFFQTNCSPATLEIASRLPGCRCNEKYERSSLNRANDRTMLTTDNNRIVIVSLLIGSALIVAFLIRRRRTTRETN